MPEQHRIDVTHIPPGAIERMAASDARPSPEMRAAMERVRKRRATDPEDVIDDEIEKWHGLPENGVPLHDFLGMSWEEYARFAEGRMKTEELSAWAVRRRAELGGAR